MLITLSYIECVIWMNYASESLFAVYIIALKESHKIVISLWYDPRSSKVRNTLWKFCNFSDVFKHDILIREKFNVRTKNFVM